MFVHIKARTLMRGAIILFAFLMAMVLSGCGGTAGGIATGLSVVSFVETDKFLGDHMLSLVSGRDCATSYLGTGGALCRDKSVPAAPPPLYCYETLGQRDCYSEENPYAAVSPLPRKDPTPKDGKSGDQDAALLIPALTTPPAPLHDGMALDLGTDLSDTSP